MYSDFYQADLKKFFDHFLYDVENDWEKTPQVRLTLFHPGGKDVIHRPEQAYPPDRMQAVPYFWNLNKMELEKKESDRIGFQEMDLAEGVPLHLNYTFDSYTEIVGGSRLKLWIECLDRRDANLFVRFYKIDKAGHRMWSEIGLGRYLGPEGRLRVSHRELDERYSTPLQPCQKHKRQQFLEPGEKVPVEICIWPTGLVFEAGETLQVEISGKDFIEDRPPDMIIVKTVPQERIRIYSGQDYDSHLLLPIC